MWIKQHKGDKATYRDFTACDVPKSTGVLDPIVSNRWLTAVEGAFRTSGCEERKKVIYATNFLRDSAKTWWEEKVYEKGEVWAEAGTWKDFKELFSAEYAPVEEIDKIWEKFQSLMQINEMVNELWKKFNDMVLYCPEYHGNEKLKVERCNEIGHRLKECPNTKAIEARPLRTINEEEVKVPKLKALVY
ncbi:zinc finger, CCHC-type, Retrotransposon gag domain protein [Artemisia annua]|uniref:Zinc finger, CCHC-type, Retrotransposon gag domain protein n=1 Tax=Artemisia annua TaxID=35608 RepID=A0A2U1N9P1_ARTAN|nr:zinc finger, CCHC-type, Retrotransposon gag domain protein [Artemisia annua]